MKVEFRTGDGQLGVLTTLNVLDDKIPVLNVVHNEGDDWMFFEGDYFDVRMLEIGTLAELIEIDETLMSILDLPENHIAKRASRDSPWVITPQEPRSPVTVTRIA
jgi:hypothetical protein